MKKPFWLFTFFIVLVADLISIYIKNEPAGYVFKPLLIPAIAGYFIFHTGINNTVLKKWIIAALIFSWMGDVLLLFQDRNEIFFLSGLASFLLAHIFYIIFFHQVRLREKVKSNPWLLVVVVIYYAALISWLSPYLGNMKFPVRIYGIVICIMFMLALHTLSIKNKIAGRWMVTGALFFIISDSVLAVNKFYQPFEMAGIIIILSYGLAQLFIVHGAIKYIRDQERVTDF